MWWWVVNVILLSSMLVVSGNRPPHPPPDHNTKYPGVRGTLTSHGANTIGEYVDEWLALALKNVTVDNVTHIGNDTMANLTHIHLTSDWDKVKLSVKYIAGTGLDLHIKDVNMRFQCDFDVVKHKGFPHFKLKGRLQARIDRTHLTPHIKLSVQSGRPLVELPHLDFHIDHMKLDLIFNHPIDNAILDFLLIFFKPVVETIVNGVVDKEVKKVVKNDLAPILAHIPLVVPMLPGIALNISMSDPNITSEYISLGSQAQCIRQLGPGKYDSYLPFNMTKQLPSILPSNNMVEAFVSDFTASSLLYELFQAHYLQLWMNRTGADLLDHFVPLGALAAFMDTTFWKATIPALGHKFPDSDLVLNLTAAVAPRESNIAGGTIQAVFPAVVELYAVKKTERTPLPPKTPLPHALTIEADFQANITIGILKGSPQKFMGRLALKGFHFKVTNSSIGPVTLSVVNDLIGLVSKAITSAVNTVLQPGIPLPGPLLPGLALDNWSLSTGDGYILVGLDLVVSPLSTIEW